MQAPATASSPAEAGGALAFAVVSIRQNKSGDTTHYGLPQYGPRADGWRMTNGPLAVAILTAYIPQSGAAMFIGKQIQGLPDWTNTDRYDIDAKVDESDLVRWQNPATQLPIVRTLLQAMLIERCKLAVHREAKDASIYSLVLGKGAAKFKETNPEDSHPSGTPVPGGGTVVPENDGLAMHFYAVSLTSLTPLLSNWTGRPVQDNTGLTGRYDFLLQRPALGGPSAQTELEPALSVFSALEQVGLKLEPTRGSVEVLVIDHIERPSEN